MDKSWRSCFLAEEELRAYYLLQNSSKFKSLKEIDKALAKNLERFSGRNSANPDWIVIFDKATNLFILEASGLKKPNFKTPDLRTPDLNIGCYIIINHVLSYLKKFSIWFFMLSTESRAEKLLPPDIQVKEGEKNNKNWWNNPFSRISP